VKDTPVPLVLPGGFERLPPDPDKPLPAAELIQQSFSDSGNSFGIGGLADGS